MNASNRKGITRKGFLAAMGFSTAGLCAGCSLEQPSAPSNANKGAGQNSGGANEITFALDYTPNTNHTGIYVAQEKGYFDEAGLKVTIQQPPADGADALIGAGGAQMGVTYQDYIANSLSSSNPLPYTAVAAIIQHNLSGIMSREEDHIVRPRDLNDRTYATWNLPVEQATIRSVMESDGGNPSTLKMVPYEVDDEVSGLKTKMFDAVWVYEQWAVQNARVQNFAYNYFAFATIDQNFDYYTPERIQLLGMKEWSYLISMSSHNRYQVLKKLFQPETPAVIVSRGLVVPEEMLKAARECKIAILTSRTATSRLSGELSSYLDSRLAERTSVHGVLMDIYGMGVLIQGDSGIGKSETGLELVKRGHRLVADDRVDIYAKDEMTLWGEPAEILKHLLEIRGVGIIDVMSLYGASAVKDSSQVQLAVYLENYDTDKVFDRLGNNAEELEISGVSIPRIRIPVKTGRNISVVIEAAAMNYRSKEMGFDATRLFEERLTKLIERNEMKND